MGIPRGQLPESWTLCLRFPASWSIDTFGCAVATIAASAAAAALGLLVLCCLYRATRRGGAAAATKGKALTRSLTHDTSGRSTSSDESPGPLPSRMLRDGGGGRRAPFRTLQVSKAVEHESPAFSQHEPRLVVDSEPPSNPFVLALDRGASYSHQASYSNHASVGTSTAAAHNSDLPSAPTGSQHMRHTLTQSSAEGTETPQVRRRCCVAVGDQTLRSRRNSGAADAFCRARRARTLQKRSEVPVALGSER